MNDKLDRVEKLIRFLIFYEKLDYTSVQKDLTEKLNSEKSVISRALNGDEKYLTDNFIDKLNASFGSPFSIDWLLTGKDEMIKTINQCNNANNNAYSTINQENSNNSIDKILEIQNNYQKIIDKKDDQIDKLIEIIKKN
jgi:carboxypeptidase C (cathepsin A)